MELEAFKNQVEKETGVPASLLTGETPEEISARAKALLAYKKEHEVKTPWQEFAEHINAQIENDNRATVGFLSKAGKAYKGD